MKWQRLARLTADESYENLHRNQLLYRIALEAIQNHIIDEDSDEDSEYDSAFTIWDRKRNMYVLIATKGKNAINIVFPDENSATILRDGVNDFHIEVIFPKVSAMLTQCMHLVNVKAQLLERSIVKDYLDEVRFGDTSYLEKEFKEFAKSCMDNMSNRTGRELYDHVPFKFNYRGRLLEYFKENGGNIKNLHITD